MHDLAPGTPDLLLIGEVAALFRVTPETIRRWDESNRLDSVRTPGGHRRFRKSDVLAALNEGYPPARQGQ